MGAWVRVGRNPWGGQYFGFREKHNRNYTDCAWQPSSTVDVSPIGAGNGSSRTSPASVASALAGVTPGRTIVFTAGTYSSATSWIRTTVVPTTIPSCSWANATAWRVRCDHHQR
jgi:hypothetical protein